MERERDMVKDRERVEVGGEREIVEVEGEGESAGRRGRRTRRVGRRGSGV